MQNGKTIKTRKNVDFNVDIFMRCDVSHNGLDRMPGLKYNQDSVLKRRVLIGNFKERDTFWCEYLKMEHQEDHL